MEARLLWFLLALHMVSLCCATSRPLAPPHDGSAGVHDQPGLQRPESLQVTLDTGSSSKELGATTMDSKLGPGSRPPSCEHKCYGCNPCEAIQVPTTSRRSHVGLQYTNYEPESWKCKCGPSFYSP